jgi:hypothetical protein
MFSNCTGNHNTHVMFSNCTGNHNTYVVFSNFFENRAVYEIMWKNLEQLDRPQMTNNTAHAQWMLNNQGYRQTLKMYNTVCPRPPTITRTRFSVTIIRTLPVLFMVYIIVLLAAVIIRRRTRRLSKAVVAEFLYESDPNETDRRQTTEHSNWAVLLVGNSLFASQMWCRVVW